MSFKIEVSTKHPLEELENLIDYVKGFQPDIFSGPKVLLILPDGISIDNAKERITETFGPKEMMKIGFLTFEQFATIIVENKERRPEIVEAEIRRLLIVESIKEMIYGDNVLAKNICKLVRGSLAPENEDIIKDIDAEFDDFLRCAYPPQLEDGTRKYLSQMEKIADEMDGDFYKKTTKDVLNFYTEVEASARSKTQKLWERSYYLSRAHMVGKAVELLKEDRSLLKKLFGDVSKVWISGISVFDVPILEFIDKIGHHGLTIRINIGSLSAERLEKRLKNGWGIEVQDVGPGVSSKLTDYDLIELPDMRRETEYVIFDIAKKIAEEKREPKDIVVFARDIGQYMSYVDAILRDYGLSGYVQTRRSLALTPAFRLAASLLNLLSLIELNKGIKASDITDPLRLGFIANWGQKPLKDFTFLRLENIVNSIGGNKEHKWKTWKKKLEWVKNTFERFKEFIEWIDETVEKPSRESVESACKSIETVLVFFEVGCSDWKAKHKSSTGFLKDRYLLTEEHITSYANRILSEFHRVQDFAKVSKKIQGARDFKWTDIKRAFYASVGSETYGVQNRDAHAIRFTEAGVSHFVNGRFRYVFDLKSGGFPRKCPSGILLGDEYRKRINEFYGPLYLRGPDTDYENEHDFFEAVVGPKSKNKIIFTMPYLDDRGHKEEPSVFVGKVGKKPAHPIKASEFIIPKSEKISPRAYWRQVSLSTRGSEQITNNYKKIIHPLWSELVKEEILPRLEKFERIVINRDLSVEIDEKEEACLKNFIHDIKTKSIPAHEINLYEECPLMYYFYKFLYCLGPYVSGDEVGKREFIPEWKSDFRLGPIPLPVRRRHISTRMEGLLEGILKIYSTSRKLENNRSALLSEIHDTKNIEYLTKGLLIRAIDYLIEKNGNIEFFKARESGWDEDLWRSAYVKINRNYFVHFARCNPRIRDRQFGQYIVTPHVLHKRFCSQYITREVIVPSSTRNYCRMDESEYEILKENIRDLFFDISRIDRERCKDCVYKSLCGEWGFD